MPAGSLDRAIVLLAPSGVVQKVRSKALCFAILGLSLSCQAASFSVYSGASYQTAVAPNSWAVAFGTAIAQTTAIATPLSNGQWPTQLANVTMQVDDQAAELYYVSPNQINFLVPDATDFGTVNVVITNTATGATQTSTVTLQNSAVGIFTSNSSGSGPGAILNGVTAAGPPFYVVTPQNGGSDLRTRLAIYCTGLRYAGNPTQNPSVTNIAASVTAQGMDTSGNQYNFTVEYAGVSDPTFPGLDQVNIVLPAQLDGAGVVTLTFTAESTTSNAVTFLVNSIPVSELALAGLTLSSNETVGGTNVTGTVSLNGVARSAGFPVTLRSTNPALSVPSTVTIPQGQASATFTISTPSEASTQNATITALSGSATFTASLQIDPSNQSQLDLFTVTPTSVGGGASFSGTVDVSDPAALGGVNVQVTSSDPVVTPPATVTVQSGNTSANFSIPTSKVTAVHSVTLTATLGSTSLTQQVTVVPPVQLALSSTSVTGGTSVTGTITLGAAAPTGGVNIALSSNGVAYASTPGIVNIAAGDTSTTFTITTYTVGAAHTVTITAADGAVGSATAMLTVSPQTAGQLQSVSVSPTQVTGGTSATGTVTLSGPAGFGGQVVTLKTNNLLVAQVPSMVTVPQGSTSATFTVTTSLVASTQTVTITATAGSISQTATLSVE
jgi:trimeric autotransporter adhesin